MTELPLATLLPEVAAIARRAGNAILEVYARDFDVMRKADSSPLTVADMRSHDIIVGALRALTPDIPILSEEASNIPFAERATWSRHWLVDPLDGTKEFVSRNGEFTVNIALIEQHAPVLGVVFVPVRDTLYMAAAGGNALRQIGGEPACTISVTTPAYSPLRIVGSRSHRDGRLESYLSRLPPHELLFVGSSIKFCLVAEGRADLYPRFGPTSEWDTAAAQAVVEAAGGAVVTLDGQPLRYNFKADLINPNFLVYGDKSRDWAAVFRG